MTDIYHDVAVLCFRYFGYTSFDQVDQLTIRQYNILVDALKLRNVDMDYRNHLQAYLNFAVQATKKNGKKQKPVYTTFQKFYDYEGEARRAAGKEPSKKDRFANLSHYLHEKQLQEEEGG